MAYTNTWTTNHPVSGNNLAKNLDDAIRQHRLDIEERMDGLIGDTNWSTADDPIIDGSTIKSLKTLTTDVATIQTVVTAASLLRTIASTTGNSGARFPHGTAPTSPVNGDFWTTTSGAYIRINGATVGPLIDSGSGGVTGSGTTGRLVKWASGSTVGDGTIAIDGSGHVNPITGSTYDLGVTGTRWRNLFLSGAATVTGNVTSSAAVSGSSLAATAGITGATLVTTGNANLAQATIGSQINLDYEFDGVSTRRLNVSETTPGAYNVMVNIDDATSGGGYAVADTKVVGARVTGWGAATGTPTRTTFATTTVTTEQLAERVKALIDDLITHGLIGT